MHWSYVFTEGSICQVKFLVSKYITTYVPDGVGDHEVVFGRDLDPGEEVGLFYHILHFPLGDRPTSCYVTLPVMTPTTQVSR